MIYPGPCYSFLYFSIFLYYNNFIYFYKMYSLVNKKWNVIIVVKKWKNLSGHWGINIFVVQFVDMNMVEI